MSIDWPTAIVFGAGGLIVGTLLWWFENWLARRRGGK